MEQAQTLLLDNGITKTQQGLNQVQSFPLITDTDTPHQSCAILRVQWVLDIDVVNTSFALPPLKLTMAMRVRIHSYVAQMERNLAI
jgi:hypothetical protein